MGPFTGSASVRCWPISAGSPQSLRRITSRRAAPRPGIAAGALDVTPHTGVDATGPYLTTTIDIQMVLKRITAAPLGTVTNWTEMHTAVSTFATLLKATGNLFGFTQNALETGSPESGRTDDLSGGSDKMSDLELKRGRVREYSNVEKYAGDAIPRFHAVSLRAKSLASVSMCCFSSAFETQGAAS